MSLRDEMHTKIARCLKTLHKKQTMMRDENKWLDEKVVSMYVDEILQIVYEDLKKAVDNEKPVSLSDEGRIRGIGAFVKVWIVKNNITESKS